MRTIVILGLLVLTIKSFEQQSDTTSIYSRALKYYSAQLDKVESETTQIFIESNNGITEKLPGQVGSRLVTILTSDNQEKVYSKHGNKIRHVKIFPARTRNDLIKVTFIPYFGECKGKR